MKFNLSVIVAMLFSAAVNAGALSTTPTNLDFENSPVSGAYPAGWGGGGQGYQIESDSSEHYNSQWSAKITAEPNHSRFGTITQCILPDTFLGGTINYTGYLKTSSVAHGWTGLWLRVDGPNGVLAFDNMQNRGVTGTVDWVQKNVSLPVAENAIRICFGVLLDGEGTVWTDALSLTSTSGS